MTEAIILFFFFSFFFFFLFQKVYIIKNKIKTTSYPRQRVGFLKLLIGLQEKTEQQQKKVSES